MPVIPKPKSPTELREARRRAATEEERKQNLIVKNRSEGQCEARFVTVSLSAGTPVLSAQSERRCPRRATEIHHMRKPRAAHPEAYTKQHLCKACHAGVTGEVGGKRLRLWQQGLDPAWTDRYVKIREEAP